MINERHKINEKLKKKLKKIVNHFSKFNRIYISYITYKNITISGLFLLNLGNKLNLMPFGFKSKYKKYSPGSYLLLKTLIKLKKKKIKKKISLGIDFSNNKNYKNFISNELFYSNIYLIKKKIK